MDKEIMITVGIITLIIAILLLERRRYKQLKRIENMVEKKAVNDMLHRREPDVDLPHLGYRDYRNQVKSDEIEKKFKEYRRRESLRKDDSSTADIVTGVGVGLAIGTIASDFDSSSYDSSCGGSSFSDSGICVGS